MRHRIVKLLVLASLPAAASGQSQTSLLPDHSRTQAFNVALGVECTHCHVQDQWKDRSKAPIVTAANMLRMVDELNATLREPDRISCATCHDGRPRPSRQPRELLDPQLAKWPVELAAAAEPLKITMSVYNIALGVTCDHCHSADWKSKDKAPMKKVSLMNSLFEIFPKHMPATARTQCYMCHKGSMKPR